MTEKRFNIKPSAIVDDVTVIIDNQKEYTFPVLDSTLNYMFCKVLNEQHEQLEMVKLLADHRGEIIAFANSLIQDLGGETEKEMWETFKGEMYQKWKKERGIE